MKFVTLPSGLMLNLEEALSITSYADGVLSVSFAGEGCFFTLSLLDSEALHRYIEDHIGDGFTKLT